MLLIGAGMIVACALLMRYRRPYFDYVVRQNTALYGRATGERMKRAGIRMGVVLPAVFGIVLGSIMVVIGIFVPPNA
jgi:hypothetical protein